MNIRFFLVSLFVVVGLFSVHDNAQVQAATASGSNVDFCIKMINASEAPLTFFQITSSGSTVENRHIVDDQNCVLLDSSQNETVDTTVYAKYWTAMPPKDQLQEHINAIDLSQVGNDVFPVRLLTYGKDYFLHNEEDAMKFSKLEYEEVVYGFQENTVEIGAEYVKRYLKNGEIHSDVAFDSGSMRYGALPLSHIEIPFLDIQGHFAKPYVEKLFQLNILNGKTPTAFEPDQFLTRSEAIKLIVKSFAKKSTIEIQQPLVTLKNTHPDFTYAYFKDVPVDAWYAPYVYFAVSQTKVLDKTKEIFRPGDTISRAEFAKLVVYGSILDDMRDVFETEQWMQSGLLFGNDNIFQDVQEKSWYYLPVSLLVTHGIIDQKDHFFPNRPITRGEAAKILSQMMKDRGDYL